METIRVGLVVPHTDTTLELDLRRELPDHYSIHTERMWLEEVTLEAEKKMIKEELPRAIKYLRDIKPNIVIFGCTSAGSIYGLAGDEKVKEEISKELNCPVVSAYTAVYKNLNEVEAKKIAVLTPYVDNVTAKVVEGLRNSGLSVIFSAGMGITDDIETGMLNPEEILEFVKLNGDNLQDVDTLFLSCTNLRALECKGRLQNQLGMNVVTSNDAIINEVKEILNKSV